jgi:myosin-5
LSVALHPFPFLSKIVIIFLINLGIIALAKKCEDDYIYGFWISNIMELMSVIGSSHVFKEKVKIKESKAVKKTNSFAAGLTARLSMASLQSSTRSVVFSGANDGGDLESSMEMLLSNLEVLLFHLYDNWVKNIKKRVSVMCVPAILDHQPLHDYKEKEDTSTWGFVSGMMKYTYSIQELIDYLKPIATTMVAYYMEESIKRQLLTEIVRSISVTCFNTLINTKMYCTFNRGTNFI